MVKTALVCPPVFCDREDVPAVANQEAGAVFPSYLVTPSWQSKDPCLLVRAVDAVRLCRSGGYQRVRPGAIDLHLLDGGRCNRGPLCDFIASSGVTRLSLADFDDHSLVELLRGLVSDGQLAVVRACDLASGTAADSLHAQRRLLTAIDKALRRPLSFAGRIYRLVADADESRLSNRDRYMVVGHNEADRILEAMAQLAEPGLGPLLSEARGRLTQDWRPPLSPDGLILLRAMPQVQAVREQTDADGWRPAAKPRRSIFQPTSSEPEPPVVDATRQAQTLVMASRDGVPFCEICEQARRSAG
jgi:hypothetical protein